MEKEKDSIVSKSQDLLDKLFEIRFDKHILK